MVLWLTRRLLERRLPIGFDWLEQQTAAETPRAAGRHRFAQAVARAALEPQAPVQAEAASANWLVCRVDITRHAEHLRLVFRGPELQSIEFRGNSGDGEFREFQNGVKVLPRRL